VSKLPPNVGGRTPPKGPVSKIGPVSLNRAVAQSPEPADTTGAADHRTFVDTFFTRAPVEGELDIIYNGDRVWAKVTLTLETAGPVAIGNLSSITPALSGKGQLLETDVPAVFFIAKGTRLYFSATGVNRVKRVVEPIPWLETIAGLIKGVGDAIRGAAAATAASLRSKL
jgi:hypothetical protein